MNKTKRNKINSKKKSKKRIHTPEKITSQIQKITNTTQQNTTQQNTTQQNTTQQNTTEQNNEPNNEPNTTEQNNTSIVPLKIYYNSPSGTFDIKQLTHHYMLETKLFISLDEVGYPSGEQIGSVLLNITNGPSYHPIKNTILITATFFIYDNNNIYGTIVGYYSSIIPVNPHGIFNDGTYTFNILLATDKYFYLNPINSNYNILTLKITDGIRELIIPSNTSNLKIPIQLTDEQIMKQYDCIVYYKYFNSSFDSLNTKIQRYDIDSTLFVTKEDIILSNQNLNCGHLFWNGYTSPSFTDKTKNNYIFYWTYTINNKHGKGNVHVMLIDLNIALTQQGAWAISKSNTHDGYIIYADGDFDYLNPENKIYKKYYTIIDPNTTIRTVCFPSKKNTHNQISTYNNIPNQIVDKLQTYNIFYTGIPTIIGSSNLQNNKSNKSKSFYSIGSIVPDNINIKLTYNYKTYTLYTDVYEIDTHKYIGISVQTYNNTYINKDPVTICYASYCFINGTFICLIGVNNKDLNNSGSLKDGIADFRILCSSSNYNNPIIVNRSNPIEVKDVYETIRIYKVMY
jgi:hypothetical protein